MQEHGRMGGPGGPSGNRGMNGNFNMRMGGPGGPDMRGPGGMGRPGMRGPGGPGMREPRRPYGGGFFPGFGGWFSRPHGCCLMPFLMIIGIIALMFGIFF